MGIRVTPCKRPETGVYHIPREIPARICAAFEGKRLRKKKPDTKRLKEANPLFVQANGEI
ncbi:MAG: hypothetical protein CMN72_07045 [Sphingomonas sp.]|nr:hypothetical protein [Sphingomonas sp.]